MNYFVDLKRVFTSGHDRTVVRLEQLYRNQEVLTQLISDLIKRWVSLESFAGKRVLLKPNWVRHSFKETDEICLRTHDTFLLSALEEILRMHPEKIVIGDAPIQGCNWKGVVSDLLIQNINHLSQKYSIPVEVKDFRRRTFDPAKNNPQTELRSYDNYLIFDLARGSYLEPVSSPSVNPFRVTCYDPDRLAESHGPGVHKYCITKELFDADIVFSLPKIKTHQKTGVTGAIKNLVGLNGDKDYLPHHRIGGTDNGGDCYPGSNFLRYCSELAMDNANRRQGKMTYRFWQRISSLLWRLSFPKKVHQMAAGWYGNDTAWRMVLDLNKIALYGTSNGKISSMPQRVIYSLCDGIIGGQGDGPLCPEPLPLGIICFSNHSYLTDISMAMLMGFDFRKIPLLSAAEKLSNLRDIDFYLDGNPIDLNELSKYAIETKPPPGWAEYLAKQG
jgi:uncharacterized protein (DUF362 family)